MMEHIDYFASTIEGSVDFEGQRFAERILLVSLVLILLLSIAVSFLFGVVVGCYSFAASFLIASLLVIPPWPIFNRHSVQYLHN